MSKKRITISLDHAVYEQLSSCSNMLETSVPKTVNMLIDSSLPNLLSQLTAIKEGVENGDSELMLLSRIMGNSLSNLQHAMHKGIADIETTKSSVG